MDNAEPLQSTQAVVRGATITCGTVVTQTSTVRRRRLQTCSKNSKTQPSSDPDVSDLFTALLAPIQTQWTFPKQESTNSSPDNTARCSHLVWSDTYQWVQINVCHNLESFLTTRTEKKDGWMDSLQQGVRTCEMSNTDTTRERERKERERLPMKATSSPAAWVMQTASPSQVPRAQAI